MIIAAFNAFACLIVVCVLWYAWVMRQWIKERYNEDKDENGAD
jgi:low temperature requirement protein LtrA